MSFYDLRKRHANTSLRKWSGILRVAYFKLHRHFAQLRLHPPPANARRVKHPLGDLRRFGRGVLVREVDDLADAALDDRFAAFVAREQGDVDTTALQ